MIMRNKSKIIFIAVIIMIIIGVATGLFYYNMEGFIGNRIKNPDSYLLEIERMNGTDLHTLDLQAGDVLKVEFETVKGSLDLEIKAPDGTTIYRGDGKAATDFTVNISKSGVYTVNVLARHARGRISIQCV